MLAPQSPIARLRSLGAILAPALSCAIALSLLQAAPEQKEEMAPKSIAGMKMKYSDLHGHYVFTFARDGTYSWTSSREGEQPEKREGDKYQWRAKGGRNAVLDLGDDDIYTLTFDSPTHAKGKVKDDVRTYSFTFEK